MSDADTQIISQLFKCNEEKRLVWNGFKKDSKGKSIKNQYWQDGAIDWPAHINGTLKQGGCLNRNGKANCAVIDVDKDIEAAEFCREAYRIDNQIKPFKSPSGRWHAWKLYHADIDVKIIIKDIKRIEKEFVKLYGKAVDVEKTQPTKSGLTGINLPFCTELKYPYSPQGIRLTVEQFIFSYRFQHHPLVAIAAGFSEPGRHKLLLLIAAYLHKKNKMKYIDEVIGALNSFDDDMYIKRIKEKKIHEKYDVSYKIIQNKIAEIVGHEEIKDWDDEVYNDNFELPDSNIAEITKTKVSTKLITYNINEYMNLGIKPTQFIIERLIKEHSITYISGPKGNGKTEFTLGILNALARGVNFLNYTCPEPLPVVYVDGEMDPYDIIERSEPYIEKLGQLKDPNYFRIINHAQQKDETIPDIKTEIGQKLIEDQAELSRKLTEKSPVVVLDNLRSLSNYKENDSDEYRLINAWLLKMRARKYSIIVIDHHGKAVGGGPRGTSTKTDNANTSLLINSVREKGNPFMVMKIAFDKARGLKPNETEEFEAVYDFAGGWTRQEARAPKGEDDLCRLMKVLYDDHDREEVAFQIGLDAQLVSGKLDAKSYATIKKNHKGNLTQKVLAEKLSISVGKLNKILNEGIYQRWLDRLKEEDKKSHF